MSSTTSSLHDRPSPLPHAPGAPAASGAAPPEQPFGPAPDSRYFYRGGSHGSAFERLQPAISTREGVILLTGASGVGKTTLCRALVDHMDRRTFTALVHDSSLSEDDLLRSILQDFGVVSRDEMQRGRVAGVTRQELLETLDDFLLSLVPLGAGALLIVDDAQELPIQTLEQIRGLADLGTEKTRLQLLLAGEPEIDNLLKSPTLRQLEERVSTRAVLEPFTAEQTAAYIAHRMAVAGGDPPVQFAPAAAAAIHRSSGGVPRLINLLCERALLGAHDQHASLVTPQVAQAAAASLDLPQENGTAAPVRWKPWLMVAGGLILVAVIAGAYGLRNRDGAPPATAPAAQTPAPAAAAPAPAPKPAAPVAQAAAPEPKPATPTPAPVSGGSFSVLVASFRQPVEAAALSTQLRELGLPVRGVRVVSGASGVWHQVLVGPYGDAAAAEGGQARVRRIPGYADAQVISR